MGIRKRKEKRMREETMSNEFMKNTVDYLDQNKDFFIRIPVSPSSLVPRVRSFSCVAVHSRGLRRTREKGFVLISSIGSGACD